MKNIFLQNNILSFKKIIKLVEVSSAGYAEGIISAAVDGQNVAKKVVAWVRFV